MTLHRREARHSLAITATTAPGKAGRAVPALPGRDGRAVPALPGRDGRAVPGLPGRDGRAAPGQIKRYRRFCTWDYARGASLFVTIVTAPRRPVFGEVRENGVLLSPMGRIVEEALLAIPRLNPGILLFKHVVMPDHVHLSAAIEPGLPEPLVAFGKAIGRFKNYTTKQAKLLGLVALPGPDGLAGPGLLWQQGCHDWLCPTRRKIDATDRYIDYNPRKWWLMHGMPDYLRIHEPLDSPRLSPADYWKGVGNVALLDPATPMVSLRVSMKVRAPAAICAVVARMEAAVAKGYVIVSGFISQGEQAVRDMLCRDTRARFVRMRPSCIPNARFKPESVYVEAFAEGRFLEIAKGNDETEFGRGACLDLNDEIVEIATAGEGLALHWRDDGPHVMTRHSLAITSAPAAPARPGCGGRAVPGLPGRDGRAVPGLSGRDGRAVPGHHGGTP